LSGVADESNQNGFDSATAENGDVIKQEEARPFPIDSFRTLSAKK
jgi:hypothetical protein